MRRVRENILTTSGDQGVYPANTEVFACGTGNSVTCNVLPGQLVWYDPRTNISLAATVTPAEAPRAVLAVGWDSTGNGVSDTLRKCFGEQLYGNNINAVTAEPPRCGVANIHDLLFKCTDCAMDYTLQINVEDDSTQNTFPYNRPSSYTYTVTTDCCDCDTCTSAHSADSLACKMVDAINGSIMGTDPTQISTFKKPIPNQNPFYAVRLFSGATASQVWCLTPNADACGEGCVDVGDLFGYTLDGGDEVPFVRNAGGAGGETLLAQLPGIIDQLNAGLGTNGSATLTSGAGSGGSCCMVQLEINSCYDVALLSATATDIPPCSEGDPLASVTFANECTNCGDTTTDVDYEAGIRIIAKTVDLECNCQFPPNPPTGYFGRKLSIHASTGFDCGATYVRETQPMELPQNMGYQWQWREYTTDNGGKGRGHNPYNDRYGPIGLPGKQDRASAGTVSCKQDYCSYIIDHGLPHTNNGVSAPGRVARGRTVVLVPNTDTTTKSEFETLINAYIAAGAMPSAFASVTCDSDQDQSENTGTYPEGIGYPNANGYLV